MCLKFVLLLVLAFRIALGGGSAVSFDLDGRGPHDGPTLPSFLAGKPEDEQTHDYSPDVQFAPHTAYGEGLQFANVGVPSSFTIQLAVGEEDDAAPPPDMWNTDNHLFIYVWIANADQIFIAEVVNNGDGTLTATYQSDFPGDYLVYIEAIALENHDEGLPIAGSPFALTISGDDGSSLDIDGLPVCGTEEEDIASTFWRPGTWVSSNIASATHGVMRDGWVFQPKTCVYDTFSYEELMLLAGLKEPTWLVVLGGSVQRGVFLTLVDMVLAQGQKDDLHSSALAKCWGYADIQVGNLRITYQDFRLYTLSDVDDATICNNEKLESGSTAMYVRSCEDFLGRVIFEEGTDWPSVILAPSNMIDSEDVTNVAIEVVMEALPPSWNGKLLMVDHMAGFGSHWSQANPTMTALEDVSPSYHGAHHSGDNGLGKMARYEEQDERTTFFSVFPMYQSKLFENQNTRDGNRHYGSSVHYHYLSSNSSVEAHSGAKMVHSTMTEMISNIMIGKAVGTKGALYAESASAGSVEEGSLSVRDAFKMCTDCPSGLLPFHVQPDPEPVCATLSALPGNAPKGEVWNNRLCPDWCLATEPVSQKPTESGPVDVRICPVQETLP